MVRPRRRWFQFSLGSLLLATTVFGLWFGNRMDCARRQQRAVNELNEAGDAIYGRNFLDPDLGRRFPKRSQWGPKWLRKILSDDFFDQVGTVYIYESTTDDDLKCLENLPDIESLVIDSPKVTNDGLEHLKHLRSLKELLLHCPNVTDAGMLHLRSLQDLRFLNIACPIKDDGILTLESLKKLETLQITGVGRMNPACCRAAFTLHNESQLEAVDLPLSEVCAYLCDLHLVSVSIDEEASLATGRKAGEIPITVHLNKLTLEALLDAMLKDTGFDWILTPDGIVITTEEKAADRLAAVRDLKKRLPNLKTVVYVVAP